MRTSPRSLAVLLTALCAVPVAVAAPAAADLDAKRYIASFHSEAGCRKAGDEGVRKGKWTRPDCIRSFYALGTWDLWVD
ncbi:hypothetical protein [Nonomuraea sp. NPDC048826]|uniref:hypothetical protein n=1 Tax=Nonomuraea sp. NPDC048826 TaxID=3364347 RepID=UPI00371598A3